MHEGALIDNLTYCVENQEDDDSFEKKKHNLKIS